jgi:serine/threonine-protein kinase
VWLSKAGPPPQPHAPERGGDRVADHLVLDAVRRLEVVAVLTIVFQLATWLTVNLLQGTLVEEFTTGLEWGFPVGVMAASLGVALLGSGGMGEVWRASHRMLARPAAIKLIHPKVLGEDRATAAARFAREAQAIASLESPNTVALYDFGATPDGTLYYAMELLDGVDLEDLVRQHGPLPAERVAYLLRQACASLAEAHGRRIIHRDVKPANIYVCRRAREHDVVKLLDFGLVKRLAPELGLADVRLTHGDGIAGTPGYLAPEIVMGDVDDERADLYALGCVAFWLLTGRLVFETLTTAALLVAHAREAPRPPSALAPFAVPEALDRLVLDCLAKDPARRPQSAEAIADRLASLPFVRPWTPAAAAEWWEANRPLAQRP